MAARVLGFKQKTCQQKQGQNGWVAVQKPLHGLPGTSLRGLHHIASQQKPLLPEQNSNQRDGRRNHIEFDRQDSEKAWKHATAVQADQRRNITQVMTQLLRADFNSEHRNQDCNCRDDNRTQIRPAKHKGMDSDWKTNHKAGNFGREKGC